MHDEFTEASKALEAFFRKSPEQDFAKRSVIIGYGEPHNYMYYITCGSLKVVTYSNTGRERIHHIYAEGELFPLRSLFGNQHHKLAYIAHSNMKVCKRRMDDMQRLITEQPQVLLCITKQQMDVYDRVLNLGLDSAEARIAQRLLNLAQRFGTKENSHTVIDFPMTIKEFGDSVGLSRETTGRIIKKLEGRHMLAMGRSTMIVHPQKLEKLVT